MEKHLKAVEMNLEDIKDAWKREVEKNSKAEKLHAAENKAQKLKISELEKQNESLKNVIAARKMELKAQEKTMKPMQDKYEAQRSEIDFIHKKLEEQQSKIDILEAEKKSFEARFNEANLKLRHQQLKQQASQGEIPPLIPDQAEKMEVNLNPLSPSVQPEKDVKREQSSSVPLVNTPQSTPPEPTQAKTEPAYFSPTDTSESETEPENPSSNREQKRFVCGICLKDWYRHKTLKSPRNIVKSFTTKNLLNCHVFRQHKDKTGARTRCYSDCPVTMATGETKPKRFKCTALTRNGLCHERFKCRLHFDRHVEIDHANISALDKYTLADLYKKHLKK